MLAQLSTAGHTSKTRGGWRGKGDSRLETYVPLQNTAHMKRQSGNLSTWDNTVETLKVVGYYLYNSSSEQATRYWTRPTIARKKYSYQINTWCNKWRQRPIGIDMAIGIVGHNKRISLKESSGSSLNLWSKKNTYPAASFKISKNIIKKGIKTNKDAQRRVTKQYGNRVRLAERVNSLYLLSIREFREKW